MRLRLSLLAALIALIALPAGPRPARAQLVVDTLFAWQGYGQRARCRVQVYRIPPDDDRTHTVVLRELAENHGPSTLDDARHLVELVGRQLGVDPEAAHGIFYWGPYSYDGARPDRGKELFLRATFRRTGRGALGAPSWRLLSREEVDAVTDRLFR
jgi:hypothetical protein